MMASSCQVIKVELEQTFWEADPLWIGIAFLIGCIIGLLFALPCIRCCIRDYFRKRQPLTSKCPEKGEFKRDAEEMRADEERREQKERTVFTITQTTTVEHKITGTFITQKGLVSPEDEKSSKRKLSRKQSKKGGKKDDWVHLTDFGVHPEELIGVSGEPFGKHGLSDALIKPNGDAMDLELNNQDFDFLLYLEKELRDGRITTFNQLVKMLLNHLFQNGQISPEFYKTFSNEVRQALIALLNILAEEQRAAEEKIRNDPKYSNDPVAMEKALEKLPSKFASRLSHFLKEEQETVRNGLLKGSELSEDEVNEIMAQLTAGMAASEIKFSDQLGRQAANFEERLMRRKQLAAMRANQKKEEVAEIDARREALASTLQQSVVDGKMSQKQMDEILREYNENLVKVQEKHDLDLYRQQAKLNERLAQLRIKRLHEMQEKQTEETEDLLTRSDQETNTGQFIQTYSQLKAAHSEEKERLLDELDSMEAHEMNELVKNEVENRRDAVETADEDMSKQLQLKASMSEMDAQRILRIHEQEMQEYNRIKKAERKKTQQVMEEKLAQRKRAMEDSNMRMQNQQAAIREQQQNTLNKVLEVQPELDEEAKRKILVEHEKNMQSINNQLHISRLRQQKQLELKLSARKAKFAEIKEAKEQKKRMANEKEREKIEKELEQQTASEEALYNDQRKRAIEEMRMRLKQETEEALKAQEATMGLLIGRLQVGKARRAAIIQKQDKTLQELQDQISGKVKSNNMTDQLLQQHYNNVSFLNDQLQSNRDRQEQMLMEKLQAKKLKKEREIETKLETQALNEMDKNAQVQGSVKENQELGVTNASNILTQLMMENRHKQAMHDLEHEMELEMQKNKDNLNKDFETELQSELENQRKSFLMQIAAVSNLSKEEIGMIVDSAVKESGQEGKAAKKLARHMRAEILANRPETGGREDDDNDPMEAPSRRSQAADEGYDNEAYDEEEESPLRRSQRPRSGKKKKPRPMTYEDDDDDF
ncbi:trichohyalin-like isoform X2 [Lineus longissimus]|uniref:trichohyalin-like isoform X2 n=1 Tax=Lineus longissimus TaxID=88925 RepID=UPI002B4DDF1C